MGKMKKRARIKQLIEQAINRSIKVREAIKTAALLYGKEYEEQFMMLYLMEKLYSDLEEKLKEFDDTIA